MGGPHNAKIMEKSVEEIKEIDLSDMRRILGINPKAEPLFSRFFRWTGGMPQYTVGHLDRIALIDARCAELPGLALAGGAYRGVGIPNCIESGEGAVAKVLGDWGVDYSETEEKRAY
jgi:oxygen-dependent protoporphyrinogen oxidase